MSDYELVKLDEAQFKQLDDDFDGLNGALNKLTAKLAPNDKNKHLHQALTDGFKDLSKWLSIMNETQSAGFAAVVAEIAKLNTQPPPLPKPRGTIMADYQVPADQPDGRVTFHITATDSEGNEITDPAELAELGFDVSSSNDAAFSVLMDADQPDPANRVGSYHVGGPGQAAITSNLKQADGDLIATGTDGFTVTTGEATLGSVTGSFEGLTPIT